MVESWKDVLHKRTCSWTDLLLSQRLGTIGTFYALCRALLMRKRWRLRVSWVPSPSQPEAAAAAPGTAVLADKNMIL